MCVYTLDLMTVTTQSGDSIWSCQHHTSYRGAKRSIICCCCCLYWRKGKTNSPSSLFYPIYIQKLDIVNKYCAETFLHSIHSTRNYVLECDRNDIRKSACSGLRYLQIWLRKRHARTGTILRFLPSDLWVPPLVGLGARQHHHLRKAAFLHPLQQAGAELLLETLGEGRLTSSPAPLQVFSTSHDLLPAYV